MTDDNSNSNELVDIPEDLSSFKAMFMDEKKEPQEAIEDNALATDEDTDAVIDTDEDADEEESPEEDDASETPDDDGDQEEEEEKPAEEDKSKRKKPSAQTRINELTRNYRQEQRERAQERAEFMARIEALETRKPDSSQESPSIRASLPQGAPTPDAVNAKGEPKYPLGEFDPQFIFDLTEFSIEHKSKEIEDRRNRETQATQIAQAQTAIKAQWAEKLEAYEENVPDIRDSIENLVDSFQSVDPAYGEYLATTIMTSENGPAIMEYLSQNIGEAQKIVASGPAAATFSIGRLDAKLSKPARLNEEEKRNKKTSGAAPPPPKGTRGSSKGNPSVRPDTEDLAAFKRVFLKS